MKAIIGIIGGSGIEQIEDLKGAQWNSISSPFGKSSDDLLFGEIDEVPIVFLPRHGRGHKLTPTAINYRANIDCLKRAGVTDIISLSAVGSCWWINLLIELFPERKHFLERVAWLMYHFRIL